MNTEYVDLGEFADNAGPTGPTGSANKASQTVKPDPIDIVNEGLKVIETLSKCGIFKDVTKSMFKEFTKPTPINPKKAPFHVKPVRKEEQILKLEYQIGLQKLAVSDAKRELAGLEQRLANLKTSTVDDLD